MPVQIPGTEQYEKLLEEAARMKGVSLGLDAWRRLRRNYAAMTALIFLFLVALGSTFVSFFPLQSPKQQNLKTRIFEAPSLQARALVGNKKTSGGDLVPFSVELKQLDLEIAAKTAELQQQLAGAAGEEDANKIRRQIKDENHRTTQLMELLWPNPGLIDRALIRARIAVFGDWCIPSLCGTDQMGRDELARICWGSRVSLIVGIVATMVSLVIGVTYG
ncbi:MAG: hypothetical protein N2C12_01965, partial [Planctomycetales bacterium]